MSEERWEARYREGDAPWDSGVPSVELARVLDAHDLSSGGHAIDLGCGTGTNAVFLAQRGFRVAGVDLSATAIAQARARVEAAGMAERVELVRADLLASAPDLAPADLVFDRGVYHVLRQVDLAATLRTLAALTRPGSWYVVLTGNADDPASDDVPGPPRVHAHELCAELQPLFDLVALQRYRWSPVRHGDLVTTPLGWSGVFRRVERA
jgi:methyl halide transferase